MDMENRLKNVMRGFAETEPAYEVVDRIVSRLPERTTRRASRWIGFGAGATVLAALIVLAAVSRPEPPNVGVAGASPVQGTPSGPVETDSDELPAATPAETSPPIELPETEWERSIFFWDAITGGEHPEEFRSLEESVTGADLIVVGHFTDMRFDEMVSGFGVTRSTITIDEVIRGDPQTQIPGTITLQGIRVRHPDVVETLMPTLPHLLFLYYVPWNIERDGLPPEDQAEELYDYTVIGGTQGVVLDVDGVARALDPRNPARFPGMFEGQSFETVVEATRQAARVAPAPTAPDA